jgi:Icc protein
MNRRDFLKDVGLALASSWALSALPFPRPAYSGNPYFHLALLADAHLKNGNPALPEAQALARAVGEIRAIKPAPNLVLFAGDLAHDGDPQALALGQEILADLPAPLLMVRGEGDGPADGSVAWNRLFGEAHYSHNMPGTTIIGLDTALQHTAHGPAFALGKGQYDWLTRELLRLDPAAPLIILSHAPLTPIFQPWQQWTSDADRLAPLLARFRRVLFLHGHVHHSGVRGQGSGIREWSVVSGQWPETNYLTTMISTALFITQNPKPKTQNLPIPAIAWPLPSPLEGTPRRLRPGLAPHGCGWVTITVFQDSWEFHPRFWQA